MSTGYVDIHVHCVPRDGGVRFHGWRRLLANWLGRRSGTQGRTGPEAARAYMERLASQVKASKHVTRVVLLALDHAHDTQGRPRIEMQGFAVSHEDVQAWCREVPDLFLFGASVHPHRADALEALEQAAAEGAVLVKLIPNSQGIDLADQRHRRYFCKLAELHLPLLVHTGAEFVLPAQNQTWGDIRRLRPALDEGVTVIAAHGGSSGLFFNASALRHYAELLRAYPNLYGDTAALALPNRLGALLWWRDHAEWTDRLLFGTDYPLPVTTCFCRPWLSSAEYAQLTDSGNPFDRMAILLEALKIHIDPHSFYKLASC